MIVICFFFVQIFCGLFKLFCIQCFSPSNLRGQYLNVIDFSNFSSCHPINFYESSTKTTIYPITQLMYNTTIPTTSKDLLTMTEKSKVVEESLLSSMPISTDSRYFQTSEKTSDFQSSKLTSSLTTPNQISAKHLPIWSIILIIILLLVVLVTTTIIAFFCVRRPETKVEHSQSKLELQPSNVSIKSIEIEKDEC